MESVSKTTGKVLIFSAPSGSGKTTLVQYVLGEFASLSFSVSCTTRAPRGEEKHGKDYYFLSVEEFKRRIEQEEFVEFEEVYADKFYGTLKSEVERIWKQGKVVVFDVDVKGGIALKKYFGSKALSVFVLPPSIEELRRRLLLRGTDDDATIGTRVEKAAEELQYQDAFDFKLHNTELSVAKEEIKEKISEFLNS